MNVLIIGGTGFLGYHATHEFLRRGHTVTVVARRPPAPDLFPASVTVKLADLNRLPDEEVRALASGKDAVVYAAGVDAATPVTGPSAFDFFYQENAVATKRFFTLARQSGVKRGVLINSYFSYFDKTWPEMGLSEHHPYIRSRREQVKESLAASLPDLELMILELPWVFGATPGRPPKWKFFVNYVRSPWPLLFCAGGTNMAAISTVTRAIVHAIEHGQGGATYLVGGENLTWTDFLARLSKITGTHKPIITVPTQLVRFLIRIYQALHSLRGKEGGLRPAQFVDFLTAKSFFDPDPAQLALGYEPGELEQALQDTVRAATGS